VRRDPSIPGGTRRLVLDVLRRGPHTVDELGKALALSGPAVRAHLETLGRDGLVAAGAARATARRPSRTYVLAPGAEALFCQGALPFLDRLLGAIDGGLPPEDAERLARAAGRALAGGVAEGPLPARVGAASAALDRLGGATKVKSRRNGVVTYEIVGMSCPLGSIARAHPSVCLAIESFVAAMTGARAQQHCHRADAQPHCAFTVTPGSKLRS
jgi:predicted ArsR family transcriptional regulator